MSDKIAEVSDIFTLDELGSRDPLSLADKDWDFIIAELRARRKALEDGITIKAAKAKKSKLTLEDLGL